MAQDLPDRPLSVVHLLAPAEYGGLESVIEALAPAQSTGPDRVVVAPVISAGAGEHPFVERLRDSGVDVRPVRLAGRAYRQERREVARVLRETNADIAHTHGYRPDVIDGPVARKLGVATVTTVHGFTGNDLKNRAYEWIQRRAFRKFQAVVAVSEKLRDELVDSGIRADRTHVVRNAWEPRDMLGREEARRALGLDEAERAIGWVGRLSAEKAPDVMVRAFSGMTAADVSLIMVGTGGARDSAAARATGSVASRIRWQGALPQAGRYMRAFDAVGISSWTEGTPIVLLEAMAAGVPVVTTAVGGIPQVVGDPEARLVEAGDVDAFSRALDEIFERPDEAQARADRALVRVQRDFAVAPWVDRYRGVYQRAMAARRPL